jgi:hypothetical protein
MTVKTIKEMKKTDYRGCRIVGDYMTTLGRLEFVKNFNWLSITGITRVATRRNPGGN